MNAIDKNWRILEDYATRLIVSIIGFNETNLRILHAFGFVRIY